jgi:DNA repair protein RadA/Sms
MKKQRVVLYRCSACGHEESKWLGRCPECGEWNTLIESSVSAPLAGQSRAHSLPLSVVDPQEGRRISSGIPEFDRVLGGGIMKRSSVLVGGEPGIGKSTLLLQCAALADTRGRVLYVSGEESAGQIRMRADRLRFGTEETERIEILCSGELGNIQRALDALKPVLVIIDSAQTLHCPEAGLSPGTVNQMKFCSYELISWVKEHDAALFLVAHVTKDGLIAGPKTLEHMVDTVLYFESPVSAASDGDCRFLRASKNRFGSMEELGIFTMTGEGLSGVENPSSLFLIRREGAVPPGVAVAAVLEGSRTLLVEIQALTVPAKGAMSRVFSDRIDSGRVSRVAATIEKHLGLQLSDQDLYINVAGGIRIAEVGVDLALAGALYSARTGIPLPLDTAAAGELSLAGEIRPVKRLPSRLKTAGNLGFSRLVSPQGEGGDTASGEGPVLLSPKNLKSAVEILFGRTK